VEQIIMDEAQMQAMIATTAVVTDIDAVQKTVEKILRYVATDLENRSEFNPTVIDQIIRNVMAVSPNVYGCTICFEPFGLNPTAERFGPYLHRKGKGLNPDDFAAPAYQYWTKEWYRDALKFRDLVWGEPFYDENGANANLVRAAMPFYRVVNGRRIMAGVVATGVELSWLRTIARRNMPFNTGFVMIFSRSGRLILYPREEFMIKETMDSLAAKTNTPELTVIRQQVLAKKQGTMRYFSGALQKQVQVSYKPSWGVRGGGVVVGFEESEITSSLSKYRQITLLSLIGTLTLFALIVATVAFFTLRPLGRLAHAADGMAAGNLDDQLPAAGRDDEVGRLTRALQELREKLRGK